MLGPRIYIKTKGLVQYKDAILLVYEIPLCIHNGISYTGKMASLYWIRAQSFKK